MSTRAPRAPFLGALSVMDKELRVRARHAGTYVTRGLFAFILAVGATLLVSVADASLFDTEASAALQLQRMQAMAPQVCTAVLWAALVAMSIASATSMGGAISDERRAGSLTTLLACPLTPGQIVRGKVLAGVALVAVLAIIPVPMLMFLRVFGGIEAPTVLVALAMAVALATHAAALGLRWSTLVPSAGAAGLLAIVELALAHGIWPLLILYVDASTRWGLPSWSIDALSAPVALAHLLGAPAPGSSGPNLTPALISIGCTFARAAIVLWHAGRRVRRSMDVEAPSASARKAALHRPAPRDVRPDPDISGSPMLWREMQRRLVRHPRAALAVGVVIVLVLVQFHLVGGFGDPAPYALACSGSLVLATLGALVLSCGSVSGERESRTWDVLLTTPVRGIEVLGAAALGAARRIAVVPAAAIAYLFAVGVPGGSVHPLVLVHLACVSAGVIVLFTVTGAVLSLALTSSRRALATNLMLGAVLLVLVPLAIVMFGINPGVDAGDAFADVAAGMNPFILIGASQSTGMVENVWGERLMFPFPSGKLTPTQFTLVCVAFLTGCVVLASGVLALGAARFSRTAGRSS